jgi:glycosyltransferase involved in cell wall biosynthesis
MTKKKSKIVMITMFKNESSVIKRMLDSCLPHVDYYVMQNNGSTDGTEEIAKQFLIDNNLSGEIYEVEEGWVGFGWNRDNLIQYCQSTDHGCDWILKMDCDEILEVDDDFDWSLLDDKSIQAFHIPAVSGSCVYHRAWMYNANLPWRFNHDLCHETVYCNIEGIKENFQRFDLPLGFRQVGTNEGQSWGVPTKFVSDSLKLEEELIRENTLLTNNYHFWYLGKSYFDAFPCSAFPLGESQQKEYARRSIYYFKEFLNFTYGNSEIKNEDETAYMSYIFMAEAYKFLKDYDEVIEHYKESEKFAVGRNDHLFGLANLYDQLGDYENMLIVTSKMMQPERTNPFPRYCNFIDTSLYHDSPTKRIQTLHDKALLKNKKEGVEEMQQPYNFYINTLPQKRLFVVDNFYSDPDSVRDYALKVEYKQDERWYKGHRSKGYYHPIGIKESFENILGEKITSFPVGTVNGCFQITFASDPQVWHFDEQKWAAMIYLTPNAPVESGTRLHRARGNSSIRHKDDLGVVDHFEGNYYDSTKWEVADSAGNFYNRLVIMDAQCVHSAGSYFGDNFQNGRLTHLFFFD